MQLLLVETIFFDLMEANHYVPKKFRDKYDVAATGATGVDRKRSGTRFGFKTTDDFAGEESWSQPLVRCCTRLASGGGIQPRLCILLHFPLDVKYIIFCNVDFFGFECLGPQDLPI